MPRTKSTKAAAAPTGDFTFGKSIKPFYKDVCSTSVPEESYATVRKSSLEYIMGHVRMMGNNIRGAYIICTHEARTGLDELLKSGKVTDGEIEFNDPKALSHWVHWVAILDICRDPAAKAEELVTIYYN